MKETESGKCECEHRGFVISPDCFVSETLFYLHSSVQSVGKKMTSRRGSILIMVLVLIVVVSYVLTKFVERAQIEVQSEGYYLERANLKLDAWGMMEVAVAVLADVKAIEGALYSEAQGWADPLDYSGVQPREGLNVSFEFIDETSKLSINELDEGSLFLLFDEMGFALDEGQKLANVLLDWVDEDDLARIDGGESSEYSSSNMPMRPANQPLSSLRELYYLIGYRDLFFDDIGNPNGIFEMLDDTVTIFPAAQLNVNTAQPLALQALAGIDDFMIDTINTYRSGLDGEIGTADDVYFESTQEFTDLVGDIAGLGNLLTTQINIMTIKVTVQEAGSAYTLIGVVNTQTQASGGDDETSQLQYPFLFLEVREEATMNIASPKESSSEGITSV